MYKSYLLIAGLALFMLFMAGTLLKTGESAGAAKPSAAAAKSFAPGRIVFGGPVAPSSRPAAKDDPKRRALFEAAFKEAKELLAKGDRADPRFIKRIGAATARAADLATPADWPFIEAESRLTSQPDGMKTLLVTVAGATGADAAVPFIADLYEVVPTKAIEALGRLGSHAAFVAVRNLYQKALGPEQRYVMLQVMKTMPKADARGFLLGLLDQEKDESTVLEAVTLLRFFPSDETAARVAAFARRAPEGTSEKPILLRTFNTLTGLKLSTADAAVLDAYLDQTARPEVRAAAGQALAFITAPALVDRILARFEADPASTDPALLAALERSAQPRHRDRIAALAPRLTAPATRTRFESILAAVAEPVK